MEVAYPLGSTFSYVRDTTGAARLTPDSTGPIEWTVRYGRGRVYTSTLGHVWRGDVQPVTVRDAGVQTLLVRGLQWLAKRPVTWPVPADFPTATSTSVRGELKLAE